MSYKPNFYKNMPYLLWTKTLLFANCTSAIFSFFSQNALPTFSSARTNDHFGCTSHPSASYQNSPSNTFQKPSQNLAEPFSSDLKFENKCITKFGILKSFGLVKHCILYFASKHMIPTSSRSIKPLLSIHVCFFAFKLSNFLVYKVWILQELWFSKMLHFESSIHAYHSHF